MSISTQNTDPDEETFIDVVYPGEKVNTPAQTEQTKVTATAPAPAQHPETADKAATPELRKQEKGSKVSTILNILILVCFLLILALGTFFVVQMKTIYVPTPYEQSKIEYEKLLQEKKELEADQSKIDRSVEARALLNKIAALQKSAADTRAQIDKVHQDNQEYEKLIADKKRDIDAAKFELRRTNQKYRREALATLNNLPVGKVIKLNDKGHDGEVITNAIIAQVNMQTKKMKLKSTEGVNVTWDFDRISIENLPRFVQYAIGEAELVNLDVLDEGTTNKKKKRKPVVSRPEIEAYDPAPGAPVISSGPSATLSSDPTVEPEEPATDTAPWDDLPI